MDSRVRKQWFSVLTVLPSEGWVGRCLLINYDEEFASYTTGEYQLYNNKFIAMGNSPQLDSGLVLTHWLHDPRLNTPLPQGWPDCSMESIHEYLKPYISMQEYIGGKVADEEAYSSDGLDTITPTIK